MAQLNRPQNRAYSPYTVDVWVDGPKRELSTFKNSYPNPAYENSELTHQYEEPPRLVETIAISTRPSKEPRRSLNELYVPNDLRKTADQETVNDNYHEADVVGGDSWLNRLVLFLILVVSLTSLVLVVLVIFGKIGPSCSCTKNGEQGKVNIISC